MTSIMSDPAQQVASAQTPGAAHWLSVVSHLHPRYGGMSAVVPQLGLEIQQAGPLKVNLAAFGDRGEFCLPQGYSEANMTQWPASRVAWIRNPSLRDRLREEIHAAKGVHVHGLWEQSTSVACKMAREMGKPYIISAHGMLEPWAMKNKQVKKYLYAALSERANVKHATCLHALTRNEASNYRRFGARGPIAVVPNGVSISPNLSSHVFFNRFPMLQGKRVLLFMSRLHPKKGLNMLVAAWATLATHWPEAHLVIAGPDFEGTRAILEQTIRDQHLGESVSFTGMLNSEMKWSALAAAEGFLLPSYSEGLSMSVLEAMGSALPVIVTEPCNMPEVSKYGLGWEIEPTIDQLIFAIRDILSNSRATNQEIGARGKQQIEKRYGWATVGRQMSRVYEWVQGGPLPEDVEVLGG